MNPYLKIYLIGCVVSAVLCFVLTLALKKIRISDVVSVILNIACSWACPITLFGMLIKSLLIRFKKDAVIWEAKEDDKKIVRHK